MCHELHFFLHQKDREYFDEVVAPFLRCKMEKQLVDHWLLGDWAQVLTFAPTHMHQSLNAFEKCLLVQTLAAQGKTEKACRVAEAMELHINASKPDVN